jgi:hypothetical protein
MAKKKIDTLTVLIIDFVLLMLALGGALWGEWGLVLPFFIFTSGVIVGNLNNENKE